MKLIKATQGKVFKISDEDYEEISKYKWHYAMSGNGSGAIGRRKNGKTILVHRQILNVAKGLEVDHINGDPLDNRRDNLRIVTHHQNMMNLKLRKDNTSGYKGVTWHFDKRLNWGRWHAHIQINDKNKSLGYFKEKLDAAKAYNEGAKKYFGEYARLNDL